MVLTFCCVTSAQQPASGPELAFHLLYNMQPGFSKSLKLTQQARQNMLTWFNIKLKPLIFMVGFLESLPYDIKKHFYNNPSL